MARSPWNACCSSPLTRTTMTPADIAYLSLVHALLQWWRIATHILVDCESSVMMDILSC
jgi:hypothetical protein